MCLVVLPAYLYVYAVSIEARYRYFMPSSCSYRELRAYVWVLGIKPRYSTRAANTALQPPSQPSSLLCTYCK